MWIRFQNNPESIKDDLFHEMYKECINDSPIDHSRLSYSLRERIRRLKMSERREIVSRVKDGCSLLFTACMKGHLEIVEFMLNECGANIEQRGMFELPQSKKFYYVTPLWCAAVLGRLDLVKCLVKHGADVNSVSDNGSSPVRSTCFMTHIDVVTYLIENGADIHKTNYNGGTCLINSIQCVSLCQLLLQHGINVNACDLQRKTALHYAIQEHSFESVLLLLMHGADVHFKSVNGDDALQTACLKLAIPVFKHLIEKYDYTIERKAEAYELLGASYIEVQNDHREAIACWEQALKLRLKDPANPVPKKNLIEPKKAYLMMKEFETFEELEAISFDYHMMRNQSMLIMERILGPQHRSHLHSLMYRGAFYADIRRFQRSVDIWLYALKFKAASDTILSNDFHGSLEPLMKLFIDFYDFSSKGNISEPLQFDDLFEIVELIESQLVAVFELLQIRPVFKQHVENFDWIFKILAQLIHLLNLIEKTPQQEHEMKLLIYRLLKTKVTDSNGYTFLHLAVKKQSTRFMELFTRRLPSQLFPDARTVHLLIECGAEIDAYSRDLSTPLFFASSRANFNEKVVKLLIQNGAHLDRRSVNGRYPCEFLVKIDGINPLSKLSLKCLAAREIAFYRIPYRGIVPVDLEKFISIH